MKRAPGVELVVRVAASRHELDRGARAAREDYEPGLCADRAQRVLETRVPDVGRRARSRERRGHLLEPQRLRRAPGGLGFGASAIELFEREPGLIGKAAQDGERRRVGVGDDGLPRDDEHQLRAGADDDRHAEGRTDPELLHEREPLAPCLTQHVGDERDTQGSDCLLEPRKVVEVVRLTGLQRLAGRFDVHEVDALVVDPPEHAVVRPERRSRLPADRPSDLVVRVRVELRRDLQDPVERFVRFPLPLEQASSLESLLGKPGDRLHERRVLVVERRRAVEHEPERSDHIAAPPQRDGDGALHRGRKQKSALRERGLQLVVALHPDRLAVARSARDHPWCVQSDPPARKACGRSHTFGLGENQLVALDQAQRSSPGTEHRRASLGQDASDVIGRRRPSESTCELLQVLHPTRGRLGLERDRVGTPLAKPE